MRVNVRVSLAALLICALTAVMAPVGAQAASPGFGVESFFAGNCNETHSTCKQAATPAEEKEKAELEGFTQAGGHPNFGITDFTVKNHEIGGAAVPNGVVRHIRVDVAPGVSTNPQAVPKCSAKDFGEEIPGTGVALAPTCPTSTIIGKNTVAVVLEPAKGVFADVPLSGEVYNLEQEPGQASTFGVALEFPKPLSEELFKGTPLEKATVFAHTIIEGGVEYASDYHDFFEIKVSEALPLLSSRLTFNGNIGTGGFLTNGTSCTGSGPQTTTSVTLEDNAGESETKPFQTPIGGSGCNLLPFSPSFSVKPETEQSDQPDGVTTELSVPHDPNPAHIDSSDLKTASVTLPAGLTMNPSAGAGLAGCTPAQIGIGTRNLTECPAGSRIGTASLEVPGLPAESLRGSIFLGKPAEGQITGPPYTIYIAAESSFYNVKVRLKGTVTPDPSTGQLTTTFTENPEQPFSDLVLHFNGGAFAPLANPLGCGAAGTSVSLTPFATGQPAVSPNVLPFSVLGCASPPFAPTQSTPVVPSAGGSDSHFAFVLTRPEGQQYVKEISTVLPAGVVGKIPSVPRCGEAEANAGTCSAASQIGTVRVTAGSGEPYPFTGNVFLTGPYQGAPYGLSFVVPIVAGPFNLGNEVTRARINVDPNTARVTVTSVLPTIRAGIPTRIRSLVVDIDRPNYLINPTNCGPLAVESTVTSTLGTKASISSPFQAEGCSGLAFKPSFAASTGGKPTKAGGASLVTTIKQAAGQANIKSVVVSLPKQLPSRLTTLQKACPEATFAANPLGCSAESNVGTATVLTPTLPDPMKGPAYLVSHGGAAFPDLDLVLEADGVRVILVGNTDIKKGITKTSFVTDPDVPITSVTVSLPMGPHSALASNGSLCAPTLVMPTIITGQNGKQVKQNTTITPTGCGVQIVGHKVIGNTAFLTIKTFAAGRISGSGANVKTVSRSLAGATKTASLKIPLSNGGKSRRRPLKVKLRVGFVPKKKGAHSTASVTVTFR